VSFVFVRRQPLSFGNISNAGVLYRLKQEQAVDPKTRLIMYKLVNSGILEAVNGIISCGKESVVFHADGGW